MQRKLVKQGVSTLMVSLPNKWIKINNLEKGDIVSIETEDNAITITVPGGSRIVKKETQFEFDVHQESTIRCALVNTYRSGYDKIIVHYKTPQQFKQISKIVDEFTIGMEIVKQDKDTCTIGNITEPSGEQFDTIFRKILYNISLLIDITEDRLRGKEVEFSYSDLVYKIQRFDNFCRRVITKKNLKPGKSELYWTSLTLLNHAQRELFHLHRFLDKESIKYTRFSMIEQLREMFNHITDIAIKHKFHSLTKVYNIERKSIKGEFYERVQQKGKYSIILYHLAAATRTMYLVASPLSALALAQNQEKEK